MRRNRLALKHLSPVELQKYREKQARLKELFLGTPAQPEHGGLGSASPDKYPNNEIGRSENDGRTDGKAKIYKHRGQS